MPKSNDLINELRGIKDIENWDKMPKQVQAFFTSSSFGPHNVEKIEIHKTTTTVLVKEDYLTDNDISKLSKINQFHRVTFHEGGLLVFEFSMV